MKTKLLVFIAVLSLFSGLFSIFPLATANAAQGATSCEKSFFGLPAWYRGLPMDANSNCNVEFTEQIAVPCDDGNGNMTSCYNEQFNFGILWLVVTNIIEYTFLMTGRYGGNNFCNNWRI